MCFKVVAVERPKPTNRLHRGIADIRRPASEDRVDPKPRVVEPPARGHQRELGSRSLAVGVPIPVRRVLPATSRRERKRRASEKRSHFVKRVALQLVLKTRSKCHIDLPRACAGEELHCCRTRAFDRVDDNCRVAGQTKDHRDLPRELITHALADRRGVALDR